MLERIIEKLQNEITAEYGEDVVLVGITVNRPLRQWSNSGHTSFDLIGVDTSFGKVEVISKDKNG